MSFFLYSTFDFVSVPVWEERTKKEERIEEREGKRLTDGDKKETEDAFAFTKEKKIKK